MSQGGAVRAEPPPSPRTPARPPLPFVPDHDGRPFEGLAEAFKRIDAEHRLSFVPGARRMFRAAAAADHGDEVVARREFMLAIGEIAQELRMSESEVRRLMLPPGRYALSDAVRWYRPS